VSPTAQHIVQPTVGFIHTVFRFVVDGMMVVRVQRVELGIDQRVGQRATHHKRVTHNAPLLIDRRAVLVAPPFVHNLADVVDEADHLQPFGVTVFADALGGLNAVVEVGQGDVRVADVDEGGQFVEHGLHRHLVFERQVFGVHRPHVLYRLVLACELVGLLDVLVDGLVGVLAEGVLVLVWGW